MSARVFVSSTFKDLSVFRESVRKAIQQIGAIDISMENFGARDERPKEECLKLIVEESDIFVGIYAHSYGYIPESDDISITESEYDAASLANVPRLIYLLDESTPWIPANIDKGSAKGKLLKFKNKLKANHICAFFSSKDELAAKVAADLGRYLSKLEVREKQYTDVAHIDPDREYRLIQDLKSSDKYSIKRSLTALTRSHSPWLVDYLAGFVLGQDEELADLSISALREISGVDSAKAIAGGLSSQFNTIRSITAFTLGEIALFGRRNDTESVISRLIEMLRSPTEDLRILDEVVHSLGKIGGKKALNSLKEILESNAMPPELKAKALHGPGRFWGSAEYNQFVSDAITIVKQWPIETCEAVRHTYIFDHIKNPLKDLILSRLGE
jgi:hypothetical protein